LKNNVRKEAEDKVSSLLNLKNTEEFSNIEALYKQGISPMKREDLSAALKGKSNISNYLKEVIQDAEKEVIICTNAEEVNEKKKLFRQTFEILKKRDIKIKFALSGDENLIKLINKELDVKAKKVDIDTKFFIIDRKEILFYLSKDSNDEDVAIWINSEFFSQAFASLFDRALGGK